MFWSTLAGTRRRMRIAWRERCCQTSCYTSRDVPVGYPENGRTLTDDVADHFVTLFTNGKMTGDDVGPHGHLLAEFPYLGPPHASYDH
jgi:hypothetical protein